ncbi:ATP-binding protein [Cryptosporangium japonicum]|uniref:ATP-binding protein n=1 Tax=Cryptosporangium japonicum TaxID=80872 RepID=A0ABN0V013_9ACTN
MATLGEELEELRRQSFVGRDAEIAAFRAALDASGVIFVYGPGGVGKSALLAVFAHLAAERGRTPIRVDARHLALGAATLPTLTGAERAVLLIDTYELLDPVDDWVRDTYLPALPSDCLVVIAGREGPGPRWRADPAWRALLRIVTLGNLPREDGHAWLTAQGLPSDARDRLLTISRGHPLTLSLLIDAVRRGAEPRALGDVPDVVGALIERIVGDAPSPRHRAALEVCAHAPVTTEDLLRTMIGGDVGEVFAWLRSRPFVDESPHGLHPHDAVREVLEADLRWRDPERYADLYHRKLAAFPHQVRALPGERDRLQLLMRTVVLNGARSGLEALSALAPPMGTYADPLTEDDRAPVVTMTAAWQGAEQAELAAYWMDRRPEAFRAFRTATGELCGYTACLEVTEADLGVDPGVDALWRYASKLGGPRSGERVRVWRFFLDREQGQRPSPSLTLFVACQMLDIIQLRDDTAWTFVAALEDADRWTPTMEFLDFWAAPEAEFPIGGSRYPVYAHDWRRAGIPEWTEVLHARQLGLPARPAARSIDEPVLTRPEFDDAVRSAVRTLHAPDQFLANPLLRARMIRRSTGAGRTPAEVLRRMIETAIESLPADASEVMTRTFLRPTVAQERLAAELHLSFNTYRRHRDRAVASLAAALWEHETGNR